MTIMRGPGSQYIFDTINFVNHKDTLTLGASWPPRQGGAGGGGGRRRKKEEGGGTRTESETFSCSASTVRDGA